MGSMRGNLKARVCIIAPPPVDSEYARQLPLSCPNAAALHLLLEKSGFDTNEDAFVLSCSFFGTKANKASTDPVAVLIKEIAEKKLADFFICVGDLSFKFIFGRGKMPPMSTMQGSLIYHNDIGHKPLFTLPNIDGLIPPNANVSGRLPYSEYRRLQGLRDWSEKLTTKMETIGAKLTTLIQKHAR